MGKWILFLAALGLLIVLAASGSNAESPNKRGNGPTVSRDAIQLILQVTNNDK